MTKGKTVMTTELLIGLAALALALFASLRPFFGAKKPADKPEPEPGPRSKQRSKAEDAREKALKSIENYRKSGT